MKQLFRLIVLIYFLGGSVQGFAQEWGVHINLNELYPMGNDQKSYYPALWYSSTEGRGVLLGGFGAGVSWEKPWKERIHLRGQILIGRTRHYDSPVIYANENGVVLGAVIGIATHLQSTILGMATYDLFPWMRMGTGVGLQATLLGWTNYGESILNGKKTDLLFREQTRRPMAVVLPFELSFSLGGPWRVRERLEWSLTPISHQAGQENERFLINQVEVSYTFGRPRS